MVYKDEYKVQFMTREYYDDKRHVFWRIEPSELPLLQRLFRNPWRQLYRAYSYIDDYDYCYDAKEYMKEVTPLKTYGDVRKYMESAHIMIRKRRLQKIEKGEMWPDEL
jgi:hypothetical protein